MLAVLSIQAFFPKAEAFCYSQRLWIYFFSAEVTSRTTMLCSALILAVGFAGCLLAFRHQLARLLRFARFRRFQNAAVAADALTRNSSLTLWEMTSFGRVLFTSRQGHWCGSPATLPEGLGRPRPSPLTPQRANPP